MDTSSPDSAWSRALPGLTLMVLSPLLSEILPGATRFSSIFVLPIEICMWGGGALLIRYAMRRWDLGWRNVVCLALALSVAEECLIQQTSLAPLVVQIKGLAYARAGGVNYLYLLWALAYETVFVVVAPIYLAELIFQQRKRGLWAGGKGLVVVPMLFGVGTVLAWFSWTQIARPKVFHVPVYNPPVAHVLTAATILVGLVVVALGPWRRQLGQPASPMSPPKPMWLGWWAFWWAALLYGLVVLAFGIAPQFPVWIALAVWCVLACSGWVLLPAWSAHPAWGTMHGFGTLFGLLLGSMVPSFAGFIGGLRMDLYFKVVVDMLACAGLVVVWRRLRRAAALEAGDGAGAGAGADRAGFDENMDSWRRV